MAIADAIPELGHGGRATKKYLIKYARKTQNDLMIVETGPFLGSSTAYIAIGSAGRHTIHSFDKWEATQEYVRRAKREQGINIEGKELFKSWMLNVCHFGAHIVPHKINVDHAHWSADHKIGLYVDDAGLSMTHIETLERVFMPAFVPGKTTLIMMDYYFFETHHDEQYLNQRNYFEGNEHFKFIERCKSPSRAAVFKFIK